MSIHFAYVSQGKLHLKDGDGEVRLIESQFAQAVRERAVEIHDRNAWKTQGSGARFMSGGLLWGAPQQDPAALPMAITGVSRGHADDQLVYALDTREISGIFRLDDHAGSEQRLLHTADFRVGRLNSSPGADRMVCALTRKRGNSCIAVMRGDGSELTDVTQGDAVDDAPHWLPGSANELVFQSAAIGRDHNGLAAAQGPFAIQKLNLDAGEIKTLAEDPGYDFLAPQLAADGALYYIRRPYLNPREGPGFLRALLDLALLPFRLLYAVFQYLNFFTARYTGNTLTSAGGARQKGADLRQMMIWGNLMEASRATANGDEPSGLVPKTWELIRRSPEGKIESLARQVVSFDLCPDGSIVYSNGSAVYHRPNGGPATVVARDGLIEQVIALP